MTKLFTPVQVRLCHEGSNHFPLKTPCINYETFGYLCVQNRPYHGFGTILTGRQSGQKLQCLYGNPMANNLFKNRVLQNL